MQIVTIYDGENACQQCLGWKRVANSDDQESWKYWAELPAQSAIAVQMGLVKPVECPRCQGTGVEPGSGLTQRAADECERHAANESLGFKFCPDCGNPLTRR